MMNRRNTVAWVLAWVLAALLGSGQVLAAVEANQAPREDLMAIKGLGPATSQRIVEARQQRPFSDWNDFIARVRGVGPATAARLSAHGLTVNGLRMESARPHSGDPPVWHPVTPRPLTPTR